MAPRPARLRVSTRAGAALAAVLLLAGCGAEQDPAATPAPRAALGHVHGLGTDPGSGTLYIASHLGVFTLTEDGTVSRVADRWQDTMALTVAGPEHLLASGHPDLREDLPVHLGLLESRDGAETWRPVALSGEADFHALEVTGDRLWGYDSVGGRLLTTTDREEWAEVARGPVVDLAAGPDARTVLATTADGRLLRYDADGGSPVEVEAPPLLLVDRTGSDDLVGVTADGQLHVAGPDGTGWRRAGEAPGAPHAFDVARTGWFVATADGVHRSVDEGRTWTRLVAAVTG